MSENIQPISDEGRLILRLRAESTHDRATFPVSPGIILALLDRLTAAEAERDTLKNRVASAEAQLQGIGVEEYYAVCHQRDTYKHRFGFEQKLTEEIRAERDAAVARAERMRGALERIAGTGDYAWCGGDQSHLARVLSIARQTLAVDAAKPNTPTRHEEC